MSTIITLPYDPTWQALTWAKKHCSGYITHQASRVKTVTAPTGDTYDKVTHIDYYFYKETDAVLFALRWA